jgi:hypothetical protein
MSAANVTADPHLDPNRLTDEQAAALIDAQRSFGLALSSDLSTKLQAALVQWAVDLNKKGEPIPMVSTYYCLAAAAASFVHMAAMQLRGNGFDADALGHWFEQVGIMASSVLNKFKFEDSTVSVGIADDESAAKAAEMIAQDNSKLDELRERAKRTLEAVTNAAKTGRLAPSGRA